MNDARFQNEEKLLFKSLFLLLGFSILGSLFLVFRTGINWDEFHFLSKIHASQRGESLIALQSAHTVLFSWVTSFSDHAIDQILFARTAIWIIYAASFYFLYRISINFLTPVSALFSLVALASFTFVLEHGFSFRFDPIAVFFLLTACYLLLDTRFSPYFLAGVAIALACLVTVKSVLYMPTLAALWIWRANFRGPALRFQSELLRAVLLLGGTALTSVAYLFLRRTSNTELAAAATPELLTDSFRRLVLETNFLPRLEYLKIAFAENPVFIVLVVSGFFLALYQSLFLGGRQRGRALILLGLSLPIVSLLFYRNAYPYFYWFMLPFPALLCGAAVDTLCMQPHLNSLPNSYRNLSIILLSTASAYVVQIFGSPLYWAFLIPIPLVILSTGLLHLKRQTRRRLSRLVVGLSSLVFCVSVTHTVASQSIANLKNQRTLVDLIYATFPEPVAYIDRCGMVSNYRNVGFFMSTWGMERYHRRKKPNFLELIREQQPRFLLVNHQALDPNTIWPYPVGLYERDLKALRDNFVQYWGPIWVPGRSISPQLRVERTQILISGDYQLDSTVPITIDGEIVNPGDTVTLEQGLVRFDVGNSLPEFTLRFALQAPDLPEPAGPVFYGFGED